MKYLLIRLLMVVITALSLSSCGPREFQTLTLDEFLKIMPEQYDSRGLVKAATHEDIGNWAAEFYIMKFEAAKHDHNKAAELENVDQIMYWYQHAKNNTALGKWYEIKKTLR
jgi:hypothetical protein